MKKKIVASLLVASLAFSSLFVYVSTAASNTRKNLKGSLTFWHYNKSEGIPLANAFMHNYPNVKVNVQIIPTDNSTYVNKVTTALKAGSKTPDIFAIEPGFLTKLINAPNLVDLSAMAKDIIPEMIPYTVAARKDTNGKLKGISFQTCIGGIGYKRDLAKKYLGTDDPQKISSMLSPTQILNTARKLNKSSKGKVKLFVGIDDLFRAYYGGRKNPCVKNNKLIIDKVMLDFADTAKKMYSEKLIGNLPSWRPAWSESIADNKHMCYAVPSWGVPWIIEINETKNHLSSSRWGIAEPTYPYFWGGSWYAISNSSKNKDLAWEFIKLFTSDKEYLSAWSYGCRDIINNTKIIKQTSSDNTYIDKTLNQNIYKAFGPIASKINGNNLSEYDDLIMNDFLSSMEPYIYGKITKQKALNNFKNAVKKDIPNLKVS